jgi:hypothetical protein
MLHHRENPTGKFLPRQNRTLNLGMQSQGKTLTIYRFEPPVSGGRCADQLHWGRKACCLPICRTWCGPRPVLIRVAWSPMSEFPPRAPRVGVSVPGAGARPGVVGVGHGVAVTTKSLNVVAVTFLAQGFRLPAWCSATVPGCIRAVASAGSVRAVRCSAQ